MYFSIYLSINLFTYHTLFLSPFSYFSNLSIYLPVSRSFPLRSMSLFLSLLLPSLTLSLPLSVFISSPFSPLRWIGLQDPCHKLHRTAWHQSERRVIHGLRALKYQINCASAYYKSVTLTEVDLIYIMTGIELMCGQDDVVLDDVLNDHESIWRNGIEVHHTAENNF